MTRKEQLIQRSIRTGKPIRQVAALPWQPHPGGTAILLVTSRRRGRLIIPKGWPMPRRSDPEAAGLEALQEAGVAGSVDPIPIGWFQTAKRHYLGLLRLVVEVYPLRVTEVLPFWKEDSQRRRVWVLLRAAAPLVDDPGLANLLADIAGRTVTDACPEGTVVRNNPSPGRLRRGCPSPDAPSR